MTHRRNCSLSRPCTPSAPPCCSWVACVCCVCVNVCSLCVSVCVCELTGSFSLAPEVNRKRRGLFFFFSQDIWEWWTEGGQSLLFFLTAVGAFWKVREFELGPGESVTSVANHMPGPDVWSSVFIAGGQDPSDLHKTICCLSLEKRS